MANTTQDEIYRSFLEASQQQSIQVTTTGQSLADLVLQAEQVRQDLAQQTAGASGTVRASNGGNSSAQSSGGGSILSDVMGVFGSGLSPLVKGVFSLFGGDSGTSTPSPLAKYAMPAPVDFQGAEVGGRIVSADYDQMGGARAYSATGGSAAAAAGGAGPQITVNVSAMDSRSFMDRSSDIAAAVREAMLNLNSINDVVSEL